MSLVDLVFSLWGICMLAAILSVVSHYVNNKTVDAVTVITNYLVVYPLFVLGWLFPSYIHTWEVVQTDFGPHWMIPVMLWMFAASHRGDMYILDIPTKPVPKVRSRITKTGADRNK